MKKTIWIISSSDAIEGEKWGYKHSICLSKALITKGYRVILWTSSFSHSLKMQRTVAYEERIINNQLTIRFIPCREYIAHIGFKRILSLCDFAFGLWKKGRNSSKPDCLVVSLPAPFTDVISVLLARKFNASLIIEFRDLWPELFSLALPNFLKPFAKIIFSPFYLMRRYAFANATALSSVCETYKSVAHYEVPSLKNIPSEVIYHSSIDLSEFKSMLTSKNKNINILTKEANQIWAIYAGTIGNNYDFKTLMDASIILKSTNPNLMIVVAGDGPLKNDLVSFIESNDSKNLTYVGSLDLNTLCKYYSISDIGLSIYSTDSTVAVPAKIFDYFAAELPIVNSLEGELDDLIRKNNIGFKYKAGDSGSLASALALAAIDLSKLSDMKRRLGDLSVKFDREYQYSKLVNLISCSIDNK